MLGVVWVPRDGRFPLPVEENVISGLSGHARHGLFPLPDEEKVISGPSSCGPRAACCASLRSLADCLFLLPVEEKAIAGLSGNARDGFFPLPVEGKALSGLPQDARERPFTDTGRRL